MTVPWLNDGAVRIGLLASNGTLGGVSAPSIPADFAFFSVGNFTGSFVSGDVSGVWDAAGSPYYVTCDLTVPPGQTLTIQPGVKVLFTGHYKFNVSGNLQAIGTQQDSILFTRAFPTEDSRWWGLRFSSGTSSSSTIAYCVIEDGMAAGGEFDGSGGGLACGNSSPTISQCWIRNNRCASEYYGGGIIIVNGSPTISDCIISDNVANVGGGISIFGGFPQISRCQIFRNTHSGIYAAQAANPWVKHCTITGNFSNQMGSGVATEETLIILENCIIWGNSGNPQFSGIGQITFTNIQDGYPGTGNIDADPLFVDAANGDFHLQANSPCIDAGDPTSPHDPDSTRADMGAVPFAHTRLLVSPLELDFGRIDVGTDSLQTITLRNPGGEVMPIVSVATTAAAFTLDTTGLGAAIPARATRTLSVTFAPTAIGAYADTLCLVVGNTPDSLMQVPLAGSAEILLPPVDSLVIQKGPLNGVRLDWAAVTHSVSGRPVDNVSYIIYGSTSPSGPFTPFGYATTNNFTHPYILNSQPVYFYRVTAEVGLERARR